MGLHKDVAESNMHEPKGMTNFSAGATDVGKVVVSKGDGTSEVRKLVRGELSDFVEHYGQLTISNNSAVLALTAATDSTLATNSDYSLVAGIYDAIPHGENNGISQQTNSLTVSQTGVYVIQFWADCSSSVNSTVIAFKFAVDNVITLVRRPKNFLRNVSEFHNMSAHGFLVLSAGQVIDLRIASDKTANIILEDAVMTLTLLRAI